MNMSMNTPSVLRVLIICPFSGLRRFEFFTFRLLFANYFFSIGDDWGGRRRSKILKFLRGYVRYTLSCFQMDADGCRRVPNLR